MTASFRSPRRLWLPLSSWLLLVATVCWAGSIRSDLFIEPGKQFLLGGDQPGAFKVAAHNKGAVPVTVKEQPRGGKLLAKATLAPGQRATLRFGAGSAAVLQNSSAQQANLDLLITGDTNLRMDSSTAVPR